ncbi:hypothetical protein LXL04_019959 [Taraxacum kok-saghyz]
MRGVGAAVRSEVGLDDGCGRSRLMPSFLAMEKRKEGGSIAMENRKERPIKGIRDMVVAIRRDKGYLVLDKDEVDYTFMESKSEFFNGMGQSPSPSLVHLHHPRTPHKVSLVHPTRILKLMSSSAVVLLLVSAAPIEDNMRRPPVTTLVRSRRANPPLLRKPPDNWGKTRLLIPVWSRPSLQPFSPSLTQLRLPQALADYPSSPNHSRLRRPRPSFDSGPQLFCCKVFCTGIKLNGRSETLLRPKPFFFLHPHRNFTSIFFFAAADLQSNGSNSPAHQRPLRDRLSSGLIHDRRRLQQALLSGCSARGLATHIHCDDFRGILPKGVKVKYLSDVANPNLNKKAKPMDQCYGFRPGPWADNSYTTHSTTVQK